MMVGTEDIEIINLKCYKCPLRATSRDYLWKHVQLVHEDSLLPCTYCQYKTERRNTLLKHIGIKHMKTHDDLKRHPCSICDYDAKTKTVLRRHMESVHLGKMYPCTILPFAVAPPLSIF